MSTTEQFDFDFGGSDRKSFLGKVREAAKAATSELGPSMDSNQPLTKATSLLDKLDAEYAEFTKGRLEVLELKEEHFAQHGLPVLLRFRDLIQSNRFYWVRYPLVLSPADDMPFTRLKCLIEFNRGDQTGVRPSSKLILPNRKFRDLASGESGLSLEINEELEFGIPSLQFGPGEVPPTAGPSRPAGGKPGTPGAPPAGDPTSTTEPDPREVPGAPPSPLGTGGKIAAQAHAKGQLGFTAALRVGESSSPSSPITNLELTRCVGPSTMRTSFKRRI